MPARHYEEPALTAEQNAEKLAPGRIIAAMVFALIAIAFFAFGVMFAVIQSSELPGFMGRVAGSHGHHALRAVGSLLVGLVFTAAAWFALRYQSLALEQARAADAAGQAAAKQAAAGEATAERSPESEPVAGGGAGGKQTH